MSTSIDDITRFLRTADIFSKWIAEQISIAYFTCSIRNSYFGEIYGFFLHYNFVKLLVKTVISPGFMNIILFVYFPGVGERSVF